jgi:hypothetical protein
VYEPAAEHRERLGTGDSALPLFPTNPHSGTLLDHSLAWGKKIFGFSQKKLERAQAAPDIAVSNRADYKMLRGRFVAQTTF